MPVPTHDGLFNPVLRAIRELGGSASVSEQENKVADLLNLSDAEASEIHRGNRTKLSYRLAWARNYLKRAGLLENSARGVWALTGKGKNIESVDSKLINRLVKALDAEQPTEKKINRDAPPPDLRWEDEALETIKRISPKAFETLCQRLLRESGFIQVEVTGRSGDGGIDGRGVIRVAGILSFHVIFQCKRYKETVSASVVRDFRGAMVGRADKGLLVTTGSFSRDARAEAQRDGAPPLDLIDGEDLVQKLRELRLGIEIVPKVLEEVRIDKDWFESL